MKTVVICLSLLIFCCLSNALCAQSKNQFDQYYDECMSQHDPKNANAKADCIQATRMQWEIDIDKNFKAAIGACSERERALLRIMHGNWEKYKESKFKLLDERYGERVGNSAILLEEEKIKFVRQYAQEMKNLLNSLQSIKFQTGAYN